MASPREIQDDQIRRAIVRNEHTAWLALVAELRATGPVTEADCRASAHAPPTTPGTRLFAAIRKWGSAAAGAHAESFPHHGHSDSHGDAA